MQRWDEALLEADVERIGDTEALGLDKHLMWRRGRYRDKACINQLAIRYPGRLPIG